MQENGSDDVLGQCRGSVQLIRQEREIQSYSLLGGKGMKISQKDCKRLHSIAENLRRYGKELQGYGMIGYGGTIIAEANDLLDWLDGGE